MNSPVLFLVFNRPGPTERVFSRIRESQPSKLYVACDGPRQGNCADVSNALKVKNIVSKVDWNCEPRFLFRENNLGCGLAVSSAINWFFKHEEEGIILEDDCFPSESFFRFCDEMLNLYRSDERIALVAGYNKAQEWNYEKYDYFFSRLGAIWGWATWKRAWRHYDYEMNSLEDLIASNWFIDKLGSGLGMRRQRQLLDAKNLINSKKLDTWDYQWGCARHAQNGLACMPARSLIKNIGFDEDATHTMKGSDFVVEKELIFPLRSNANIVPDIDFDKLLLPAPVMTTRIKSLLKSSLKFFVK